MHALATCVFLRERKVADLAFEAYRTPVATNSVLSER